MLKNVEYIKGVLKKTHKGRYVVKPIKTNLLKYKRMNKRAFTKILRTLKEIEDRRDFLAAEIGMDMTAYEDRFFNIIEDLFKVIFNKKQLGLLQMYLYQLYPDKDWDGKITVKIDDDKRNQVVKYSLNIPEQGLTLGNQIPNWLKINAETGEIEASPPKGLDNFKLQIIAEDEDGTLRTLEVDLDFSSNDQSKLPSNTVIDKELEKFASLQDQIHVKYNDYENYGDKLVKIAS